MAYFLAGLSLVVAGACRGRPPRPPDFETITWKIHSNPKVGFSVEVPSVYAVSEFDDGRSTLMRHDGYPCISIRHADEREGKSRGLWHGKTAQGKIELGGRSGDRYVYNHYDGPFFMRTVAYVVEHRGKSAGLEFRTENRDLDAVQRRILATFRFD